jgi:hypothetical protein
MGIAEKTAITARFLIKKQREYNALKDEIAQLQAEIRSRSEATTE